MTTPIPTRLEEFGNILHTLLLELPNHPAITDTIDYTIGALYGLRRACELGFRDRATGQFDIYPPYLANYALTIPKGESPDPLWLSGFYFNSGIQRLASAFDRIPQMLGATLAITVTREIRCGATVIPEQVTKATKPKNRMREVNRASFTNWWKVYEEINAFKHSPEGRAFGRTVTMELALNAFEEILQLLTAKKMLLVSRYAPSASPGQS